MEQTETFWNGYLAGIVTVIMLITLSLAMCHYCGYPVIVFR